MGDIDTHSQSNADQQQQTENRPFSLAENTNLLLIDTFTYYKSKQSVRVQLHNDCLKLFSTKAPRKNDNSSNEASPNLVVNLCDICGSRVGKGHDNNDQKSYLTIYSYVRNSITPSSSSSGSPFNKIKQRKRSTLELTFSKYSTYDENLAHVINWHNQLDTLSKRLLYESYLAMLSPSPPSSVSLRNEDLRLFYERLFKPFLVLVNPKSGSGKAKNIYYERVVPVWAESNQQCKIVFTQCANYAFDYMQNINIDDYRGIIVISGDGLVYEVINGLMNRPDWDKAIKIPICQIPGGSANALACSCAFLTKESYLSISMEKFASQMAFNMVKSISCPLDLVTFHLANNKLVHSFLEFEWAIVADIDLESEKYRFLGGLRFTVSAIKRIINLRLYRGRLSFLMFDDKETYTPKNNSIRLIKNNSTNNNSNTNGEEIQTTTSIQLNNKPPFKYLPHSLDDPVPDNWVTIEENFVFFLVTHLPLIAPDFMAAPESSFNDQCMHLLFIKEGISKAQLLKLFTETEQGEHLSSPFVEYVKIKAFRLEPLPYIDKNNTNVTGNNKANTDDGIMMIDGERVPYGKLQAEIIPGLGNILANKK